MFKYDIIRVSFIHITLDALLYANKPARPEGLF